MNTRTLLLATLLATLFGANAAIAGEADAPEAAVTADEPGPLRRIDVAPGGAGALAGAGIRMGGKVVKNLPYSAEVISERQHNLADGNQIASKNVSYSYRDSAGRTRQEARDDKGEIRAVTIHDPVAGATYVLNPRNKTATQIGAPHGLGPLAAGAARARIEQLRKEGKLPPPRNEIVLRRSDNDDDNVRIAVDGNAPIHIDAPSASGRAGNPRELILGPLGGAFNDMKWARKASSRELGTREIDGVRAEGKLRSYEIPAGEVGNRNPIVVSDEIWFAPELQITVLTKHSDPRSGDNIYRLASLKRDEPAASLFAVPADYTVKDALANVRALLERKAETPK
jgi:hypothetical protein